MKAEKANKLIKDFQKDLEKSGFDPEKAISNLKEIRPFAQEEEDPLVTKTLRLAYQFIEENENFDIEIVVDEDEEGNPIVMEDSNDVNNLVHYLQLILDSRNEYNRNEIRDINQQLKL